MDKFVDDLPHAKTPPVKASENSRAKLARGLTFSRAPSGMEQGPPVGYTMVRLAEKA